MIRRMQHTIATLVYLLNAGQLPFVGPFEDLGVQRIDGEGWFLWIESDGGVLFQDERTKQGRYCSPVQALQWADWERIYAQHE